MRKITVIICALLMILTSCVGLRPHDGSDVTDDTQTQTQPQPPQESEALYSGAVNIPSPRCTPDTVMLSVAPVEIYRGVSITVAAVGDNLIHPNIYIDAGNRGYSAGQEYDFKPMYSDIAPAIAAADIAFINQETVMAGADRGYSGWPCFNCPRQLGLDLCDIGFDVINIANNHMLDKTAAGLESTIDFWDEQDILLLGAYKNSEDASRIRMTYEDGISIAWLSYTYGTNGIVKSPSSDVVIPYIDDNLILSDLESAKKAADYIIVSIHWGDENTQTPNGEQKRLAKLIADNGADVILGHHSHTLQPIEWIDTDRGTTLCIYSLGNLVSGMARPVNQVGGILSFTIESNGHDALVASDVLFTPTVMYYGMDWYNTHVYYLENYTDDIAYGHGTAINGYTLTPSQARQFVTNVMDKEFLPYYLQY